MRFEITYERIIEGDEVIEQVKIFELVYGSEEENVWVYKCKCCMAYWYRTDIQNPIIDKTIPILKQISDVRYSSAYSPGSEDNKYDEKTNKLDKKPSLIYNE